MKAEAVELYRRAGDPLNASRCQSNLGVTRYFEDDWAGAREDWLVAAREQAAMGYAVGYGYSVANLAELAIDQGDLTSAEELLQSALDVSLSTGHLDLQMLVQVFRISLAQKRLDLAGADELLADLSSTDPEIVSMSGVRRVERELLRRRPEAASESLRATPHLPPGTKGRLQAVVQAQLGAERTEELFAQVTAAATSTSFERGLAFEAWGRHAGDAGLRLRAAEELRRLGIRQITTLPVRSDEQPVQWEVPVG
jgi:hypothetical protein